MRRRIIVLLFILGVSIWIPVGAEALANAMSPPVAVLAANGGGVALPKPVTPDARPAPDSRPVPQGQAAPGGDTTATGKGATNGAPGNPAPGGQATPADAPKPKSVEPKPQPVAPKPQAVTPATAAAPVQAVSKPVEMIVTTETWFRNSGSDPVSSGTATISLRALPQSRDIMLLEETITPRPLRVTADEAGNRVAEFNLAGIAPGEQLTVRQEYRIRVWGSGGLGQDGPVLGAHLQPEYKIESTAPEIVQLAQNLVAGCETVEDRLAALFSGTRDSLDYSLSSPARNRGALAALQAGSGVCEEYASLFVAMARASGIPARMVIGYGKNASSAERAWGTGDDNLSKYKHAWAEAYVPGYGWATFDPTLGRAAVAGMGASGIPAGVLIQETYKNRGMYTVYSGGRVIANWRQFVTW